MHPMNGWTEFFPRPTNQMVYAPYPTQSLERIPPYIKMDPAKSSMFDHWPHGGSYGYLYPSDCHGCCNHNYFPGHYGFRPPYPHFLPPHYQGGYPPFFGGYPEYQIPPPHYSMEHPRYEYDKGFPRDQHCCKCPDHSCKRESDENVKIEERQMDIDKKSSGSFVPSHLGNYPFPLVMIPPGYLMDSDGSKSVKFEGKEDKMINHETESTSGSLHEKETKSQQDIHGQFPFPLFWLPYKSQEVEEDDLKGTNSGQEAVIPPFQENNDEGKIPTSATGPKMIGNGATQKTTPVMKTMERVEENKKDEERKVKSIPVVQADDKEERGCAGNSVKKQASSLKSSKLPPVCLRVDPPSKSKKVNGSSRSPSPPADGRRSRQSPTENSGSLNQNEQSQVVEGTAEGKSKAQTNKHVSPSHEEASSRKSRVEGVNDVVNQDVGKATKREEATLEGHLVNQEEATKIRRKKLTDSEAAVTIQAAYRGYVVRKSEPLKKLRQIAEVNQKMLEVKSHITALDACSDAEIDEKQLVAIGETIMSLLLKLDTIQGLHSNVREIRKAVAKELVSLQEKLDSLTTRKAQAPVVPPSSETPEGPTAIITDNVSVESDKKDAEVVPDSSQVVPDSTQVVPEGFEISDSIAAEDSGDNTSESRAIVPESDQERELEDDQNDQVINDGEGQMTTENEESLELERAVETHADTQNEPEDSSSPVEMTGRADEVDEQIIMSNGVLETTELAGGLSPRDEHVLKDLEVDENIVQESYPGPVEKCDEVAIDNDVSQTENHEEVATDMEGKVDPMEDQQVQTETEHSTPVQETEANDNSEDLKVADITPEWVPPITEDRVHESITKDSFDILNIDGGDKNAPMLSEEQSEKEIPMQNDMVNQPGKNLNQVTVGQSESVAGKGEMEKGGEMVMEENKRLKEMMEKLIEAGNKQLATITKLSGKVKDLEKELSKNKKLKRKKKCKGKRQDMVLA